MNQDVRRGGGAAVALTMLVGLVVSVGSISAARALGGTAGTPDAPTNVHATAGDHQALVTWTPPADGNQITSFTITSSPGNAQSTVGATATFAVLAGLANGTSYTFSVHATNATGDGAESVPSNPVVPQGIPNAPTHVAATAGDRRATVTWVAPYDNGGPITSYRITSSGGGATLVVDASQKSLIVTHLTNGMQYTFTVVATNANGVSLVSAPSNSVRPFGRPRPPTSFRTAYVHGAVDLSWNAPSSNGSPITRYEVVVAPGSRTLTVPGTHSSVVMTGLAGGRYTFKVRAVNAAGAGPWSVSSSLSIAQAANTYTARYTDSQYAFMVKTAEHFRLAVGDVPRTGVGVIAYILKVSKHPPTHAMTGVKNVGNHGITSTFTPTDNASVMLPVEHYIVQNGDNTLYIGGLLMEYFAAVAGVK